MPLWSPQYQTFVCVTIGLLAAMYDEKRLHMEVAPLIRELAASVGSLLKIDDRIDVPQTLESKVEHVEELRENG